MHHRIRKSVISAMLRTRVSRVLRPAPASRGPLSSSPFSSTITANTSSSSFRHHSKSSIKQKRDQRINMVPRACPASAHFFYFSFTFELSRLHQYRPGSSRGCKTCTFGLHHRRERNACCSATYLCLRGVTINDRRVTQ